MTLDHDSDIVAKTKWYSQASEAKPAYILVPGISGMQGMQRIVGNNLGILIIFCQNGRTQWELDEAHLMGVSRALIKRFVRGPEYLDGLYYRWQSALVGLYGLIETIDNGASADLGKNQLVRLHDELYHSLLRCWDYFIFIDAFDPHGEHLLQEHLTAKNTSAQSDEVMVLLQAEGLSFVAEQRLDLLRIAAGKLRDVPARLAAHQRKFHWIQNNYGHIINVSIEAFAAELQQIRNECSSHDISAEIHELEGAAARIRSAKKQILQTHALDDEAVALIQAFARLTEIRDERKAMSMRGVTAQARLLRRIAEHLQVDVIDLEYLAPWEVPGVIALGPEELADLKKRRRGCLWLFRDEQNIDFRDGLPAQNIMNRIDSARISYHAELKGMVANKGKVRGRVRRIVTVAEFSSFEEGEVLVAPMTRPEFSPLIRRAAALVTDEGGVTCHAAIISREFNKPCIIGTRVATKVLSDGELVEVDAHAGVIRRLEQAAPGGKDWSEVTHPEPLPRRAEEKEFFQKRRKEAPAEESGGYILFLEDIKRNDGLRVGGKGANLGHLYSKFLVPNGFAVMTNAFRAFMDSGLRGQISEFFHRPASYASLEQMSARIRHAVLTKPMDAGILAEINRALGRLRGERFAVRSSAIVEDLQDASLAGQLDTFLDVPRDGVIARVQQCWASLYNAHAIDYRLHKNLGYDVEMATIVQEMIDADFSGVMFTLDPVHRKYTTIEVVAGLGEKLVSGEVSPSTFMLNPVTFEIEEERLSFKFDEQVLRSIARLGQEIAAYQGQPQDIEFVLKGSMISIVQSRPITTL